MADRKGKRTRASDTFNLDHRRYLKRSSYRSCKSCLSKAWLIVAVVLLCLGLFVSLSAHGQVKARVSEQDRRMSRVVPISTDGGKTWKPVWAGIKTGVIARTDAPYNFFCNEVRRPSRFNETQEYLQIPASPRLRAMLSRSHDLGQLNADAAAGMQLAIWEIAEDDEPDLSKGTFRARPTLAIAFWANEFLSHSKRPEVPGTSVTVFAHPESQNLVVLNYEALPGAWRDRGQEGLTGRVNHVPEPSTLWLLGFALLFLRKGEACLAKSI